MNYMAMAGWKTEDMLSGIEGVMYLAAASGEDLATTSDIVTDALTAFGLTAADSGHFVDVLAAAGALVFSVEDTAEAIGLMGNAGIKASQAGTSTFHHDEPDRGCEAVGCGNRGCDHCYHQCRRIHEEPVCDPD